MSGQTPEGRARMDEARRVAAEDVARRQAAAGPPAPVARSDDPWSAKIAAVKIEPTRGTRQAKVLARLREAQGGWLDGWEFVGPAVGGGEGLRRLRELRHDLGFPIERRPHSGTAWQYRLPIGE